MQWVINDSYTLFQGNWFSEWQNLPRVRPPVFHEVTVLHWLRLKKGQQVYPLAEGIECVFPLQVEKEEKEAQERAIVQKEEAAPVQEPWTGDVAVPEVSDWASESVPVSSVPVQPFGAAPAAPTPTPQTEDWSMPTKDDWSAPPAAPAPNEWGGASNDTWG